MRQWSWVDNISKFFFATLYHKIWDKFFFHSHPTQGISFWVFDDLLKWDGVLYPKNCHWPKCVWRLMILSSLGKKRRPPQKRLSGACAYGANSFRKPLFVKKNAFFATAYGKDCNRGMAVRNLNKQKSCGQQMEHPEIGKNCWFPVEDTAVP